MNHLLYFFLFFRSLGHSISGEYQTFFNFHFVLTNRILLISISEPKISYRNNQGRSKKKRLFPWQAIDHISNEISTIETIISSLQIDYDSNLWITDSFVLFDVRLIFMLYCHWFQWNRSIIFNFYIKINVIGTNLMTRCIFLFSTCNGIGIQTIASSFRILECLHGNIRNGTRGC